MRAHRSSPKIPHVSSTPVLPPAIKKPFLNQNSNEQALIQHRKQIQATLNELHRLQSEIYELNVPQNPHSSSPVKKQIKQLSYLYENMAKPKAKNGLNVNSTDIEIALRIMNDDWTAQMILQPELSDEYQKSGNQLDLIRKTKTNLIANTNTNRNSSFFRTTKVQLNVGQQQNPADKIYKIPKQKLQQKFEQITETPISLSFISKSQNNQYISTKELYEFVNFTQCQPFDPVYKAYQMFLNQNEEFDLKKYNEFNQILGLPKIKNINTFIAAIYQSQGLADGKQPAYVSNLDNSNNSTARGKSVNLIAKNSTSMTAKITFQQFKRVLDLQL